MEAGQVASGKNNDDTYLKILKQLNRITDKEAHGIASRYPNIVSLINAFKTQGPLALENIPVSRDPTASRLPNTKRFRNYQRQEMKIPGLAKLRANAYTKSLWRRTLRLSFDVHFYPSS